MYHTEEYEKLKEYAIAENNRRLPIDSIKDIKYDGYRLYSKLKDDVLFKRGILKDPLTQLSDPLSEVTRKERKLLLALSLLTFIIIKVGLFPTKISAFGIEFSTNDISSFFSILGIVILYFLFVFIVYCYSDIRKWTINSIKAGQNLLQYSPLEYQDAIRIQDIVEAIDNLKRVQEQVEYLQITNKYYSYFSYVRIVIEFVLPIVFSLYVLIYSLNVDTQKIMNSYKDSTRTVDSTIVLDSLKKEFSNTNKK